ncbi:MAG: DegT/DnrJ/EryC1/StrS family aminotransferase [Clostridia bacterium]|nr:DegT/DnrJ/EryC1/StrS family aminotransferase [Clostridia bacterium]
MDGLEEEIVQYLGQSMHGLALCSGTTALHLVFNHVGVKLGDVVLCTDMTFAATVNPVF